jgi:hypothetical protein
MILVFVLILAVTLGWLFFGDGLKNSSLSTTEKYQAVFLTNGQVYFGKLIQRGDWMVLTEVYYLQVTQALQSATNAEGQPPANQGTDQQQEIKLVKLGNELHGPQDVMYLARENVLFWENLKDESKVVDAIKRYKE